MLIQVSFEADSSFENERHSTRYDSLKFMIKVYILIRSNFSNGIRSSVTNEILYGKMNLGSSRKIRII